VRNLTWNGAYLRIIEASKESIGVSREGSTKRKTPGGGTKHLKTGEDQLELKRLNKVSKEKCTIAKETGYEDLYKDLEENVQMEIYGLSRVRQRRLKDRQDSVQQI